MLMSHKHFSGWLPLKGRSGRQQGFGKARLRVTIDYVPVSEVGVMAYCTSIERAHLALHTVCCATQQALAPSERVCRRPHRASGRRRTWTGGTAGTRTSRCGRARACPSTPTPTTTPVSLAEGSELGVLCAAPPHTRIAFLPRAAWWQARLAVATESCKRHVRGTGLSSRWANLPSAVLQQQQPPVSSSRAAAAHLGSTSNTNVISQHLQNKHRRKLGLTATTQSLQGRRRPSSSATGSHTAKGRCGRTSTRRC